MWGWVSCREWRKKNNNKTQVDYNGLCWELSGHPGDKRKKGVVFRETKETFCNPEPQWVRLWSGEKIYSHRLGGRSLEVCFKCKAQCVWKVTEGKIKRQNVFYFLYLFVACSSVLWGLLYNISMEPMNTNTQLKHLWYQYTLFAFRLILVPTQSRQLQNHYSEAELLWGRSDLIGTNDKVWSKH